MVRWDGPAPVGPGINPYSIRSWADDRSEGWVNADGSEVIWWGDRAPNGVQFPQGPCHGASCEPMADCQTCDELDCGACNPDECYVDPPGYGDAQPFWIKSGYSGCSPASRDPNELYEELRENLLQVQYHQIARQYHMQLQASATDLTGATASTLSEGLGLLLRNRGMLGLGWGGVVIPGYAIPAFTSAGLLSVTNTGLVTAGGIQVYTDPGIPVSGPGGASPPPGSAYIYIVDRSPTFAIRDEYWPARGAGWNWDNPVDRRMFWNDCGNCGSCFQPVMKRRAIVANTECAVFSVLVDIRDCSCPDCIDAPTAEAP